MNGILNLFMEISNMRGYNWYCMNEPDVDRSIIFNEHVFRSTWIGN